MSMRDILLAKAMAGGGASSWNDLKDKPFGEKKAFEPIVWDGNTEGLETLTVSGVTCYKLADEYIPITSLEQLDRLRIIAVQNGQSVERNYDAATQNGTTLTENGWSCGAIIVSSDGAFIMEGSTVPKGTWYVDMMAMMGVTVNSATLTAKTTVTPLAEQYMPILTSPSGKKFKLSVDDSGVLSATEVTE